jgi:hypothetical protein
MLVCIEQLMTELNRWTSGSEYSSCAQRLTQCNTLDALCDLHYHFHHLINCHTCITLLYLPCRLHCAASSSCAFALFDCPYNVVLVRVLQLLLSRSCLLQPPSICCPADALALLSPPILLLHHCHKLSLPAIITSHTAYVTLGGQVANPVLVAGAC